MAHISDLLDGVASPSGVTSIIFGSILTLFLIDRLILSIPNPKGLPLLGERPGATKFSLWTRIKFHLDSPPFHRQAWNEYLKKGKAVAIPGVGWRNEIMLPQEQMNWVFRTPSSKLDASMAFVEVDKACYSLGDDKYIADDWQGRIVRKEMNAILDTICAAMNDELKFAIEDRLGTDTENWKEINLFTTMRMIVAQAASKYVVGDSLCRNEKYNKLALTLSDSFVTCAGLINMTPRVLQPLVGNIFYLFSRRSWAKAKSLWKDLYYERRDIVQKYAVDDPNHTEPGDLLQMMMRFGQRERPDEFNSLDDMTRRLAALNFAVMHQTSIGMTNLVLNIIGSDAQFNTLSILREEANRVLKNDGGELTMTKAQAARMTKADSAARETLRLNSFGGRSVARMVMEGVETPEGYVLRKGNITSFIGAPVQTDADLFPDPFLYDPFRFSRARESKAGENGEGKGGNLSFVTTSPEYLPFGHGYHACPGRFLIDIEMKMLMAYLVMHYDLEFPKEYNGKRPPNVWVTEALFPPYNAKIRVRKRKA